MIRKLSRATIGAALAVASSFAFAGGDCFEVVTHVVVHSSGNVYFTTDQTCLNWCQVNWGAGTKNGLAVLMAAQATGRKVEFSWPAIAGCNVQNVTYASPDYFSTAPQ